MVADAIDPGCEWMAARQVQQRFMQPVGPVAGEVDYSARCRQAGEVGGDFYAFLTPSDRSVGLAVGDASGKGFRPR